MSQLTLRKRELKLLILNTQTSYDFVIASQAGACALIGNVLIIWKEEKKCDDVAKFY